MKIACFVACNFIQSLYIFLTNISRKHQLIKCLIFCSNFLPTLCHRHILFLPRRRWKYSIYAKRLSINPTSSYLHVMCFIYLDFHRQRVPGTGADRHDVCAVVWIAALHTVFRHAVPPVRDAFAHFIEHRNGLVLHQKGYFEFILPSHNTTLLIFSRLISL
jgi:hypothetical protein